MKKAILILLILMCAIGSQAQTTYDRKQDKRIDTLSYAIISLMAMNQQLRDSLNAFKKSIVPYNQIVGYGPIAVKDSTATIKVIYFIK